jgi:phosphopantetheine--protein transferase-like protein
MIGIDITSLQKFEHALLKTPQIVDVILHANEKKLSTDTRFVAGRFTAKEALLKAGCVINTPLLFSKIELIPQEFRGILVKINEIVFKVGVSISHDEDIIVAVAINPGSNIYINDHSKSISPSKWKNNQERGYIE